ncbi:SDR family NAD(P)-dependent oxidoreductase [Tenacibaculum agarivorans]|uniref:SDR family NAD(P)-dependent oxidoreductase n=1 Tax=Tenacibaculum agarivorans TaxID=1908389 RepID=UPI00094B7F08|nr:SDR family NAD(P)-dependent oxidoreductase [Tenacibaculum agarivorans]
MGNILIITGGSKGIGNAIATKYSNEGYIVYSLSRTVINQEHLHEISIDLSDIENATLSFEKLIHQLKKKSIQSITLIHNAGRLGQISNLENIPPKDIHTSILVNTTIPLAFSSIFIKELSSVNCKKQIITISSGAAQKAYNGWSVYCSSKAAVDMMTATIAQEQEQFNNPVLAFGIRPGVVDTNMQSQIRKTNISDFKNVQRFIDLKNNQELYTPDFVAERIFDLDTNNKLKNGVTLDLRDL